MRIFLGWKLMDNGTYIEVIPPDENETRDATFDGNCVTKAKLNGLCLDKKELPKVEYDWEEILRNVNTTLNS